MKENRLTTPRITPVNESELDDELQSKLEGSKKIFNGRVPNVFMTLANHKKLFTRWLVFSNHILGKSTIPKRDRELAILRIGWLCRSEYEWGQHVVIGRQCGLDDDDFHRIIEGPEAHGWGPFESALIRAVDELVEDTFIKSNTWGKLSEKYNKKQMMDLIFTVGQYNMLAMALNSMGVQLEEGIEGFPEIST